MGYFVSHPVPLLRAGDVFTRMIVTDGNGRAWRDEDGVVRVGIIPFLLDESLLDSVAV